MCTWAELLLFLTRVVRFISRDGCIQSSGVAALTTSSAGTSYPL